MVSQQRLSSMQISIAMCNSPENPIFLLQEVVSAGGVRYGALGWSSGAGLLRSHVGGSVEEQGSVGM